MSSERQWQSLRAWRAEQAAIEAQQREEAERPMREAEESLKQSAVALGEFTRNQVQTGRDPDVFISPEVAGPGRGMTAEAARQHNGNQARLFVDGNEWFWPSDANKAALFGYLERNGIRICTSEMYRRAAMRLQDHGLLEDRPEEPAPELVETELELEPVTPAPETYTGIDQVTGEPRDYTQWECDRMDSETFRRTFNLGRPKLIDWRLQ